MRHFVIDHAGTCNISSVGIYIGDGKWVGENTAYFGFPSLRAAGFDPTDTSYPPRSTAGYDPSLVGGW
jgi:hypothetical protein